MEPPKLPYCTQARLRVRGLASGLPLDKNCPNVALHRATHSAVLDLQGHLIPVFLGVVELARAAPLGDVPATRHRHYRRIEHGRH